MRLRLIAVGSRMPKWVEEGWHEYAKRLPSELALELVEIPLNTRGKNALWSVALKGWHRKSAPAPISAGRCRR